MKYCYPNELFFPVSFFFPLAHCYFLSCYFFSYLPTVSFFHVTLFILLPKWTATFFPVSFFPLARCYFLSCYFFSHLSIVTFFPVTFFPVTFFPTWNCYFLSFYLFSCYFLSVHRIKHVHWSFHPFYISVIYLKLLPNLMFQLWNDDWSENIDFCFFSVPATIRRTSCSTSRGETNCCQCPTYRNQTSEYSTDYIHRK